MAANAFKKAGYVIDVPLLESFADVLAMESAGHSAVVKELSDLKQRISRPPIILGPDLWNDTYVKGRFLS